MPTPKTGAITLDDINVEIKRGTSATTCSLDDVRTRTGFTGTISFSDLRGGEGASLTQGRFSFKGINTDGYSALLAIGSVSPAESNNRLQFAANSFMHGVDMSSVAAGNTRISFGATNAAVSGNGDQITAGFKTTSINYVAIAGASRSISNAVSNTSQATAHVSHTMGSSGSVDFFIRFA
jgi:hypothetical protein